MKVTLLIVLAGDGCRVRVIEPGPPTRTWLRVFPAQTLCVRELANFDLITPDEADEAMYEDILGQMLIFRSETDEDTLRDAGFEFTPISRIN
jgi:hypothetical protein